MPRGLGFALLALPALVLPTLAAHAADSLATRIGLTLSRAFAPLNAVTPTVDDSLTDAELASEVFHGMPESDSRLTATPSQKSGKRAPHSGARGVRVSAAQVLALAQRRAMPTAAPVRATPAHPAGLQLHGVSALGVGMQDGDVLTEAGGERASSVATVVGVVLAARSHHSPEISGRFYRAGLPYTVTVEQPYPPGS